MQIFFSVYFFILGALFASFFNVVGIRVLDKRSIMPRSRCPKCNHQLRWVDIIPIFGYIINRGKCHFCKEQIHPKYLFIELFGGIMFMLSYLQFGFSWEFLLGCILSCMLMVISVTEYEYDKMLNIALYVFAPILLVFQICLGNALQALLGGALLGMICFLYHFINNRAKNFEVFFIAIGIALGLTSSIFMVIITGIFLGIKLLVKQIKIPNTYLISISSIICFLYATYWFDSIISFINK